MITGQQNKVVTHSSYGQFPLTHCCINSDPQKKNGAPKTTVLTFDLPVKIGKPGSFSSR